MLSFKKYQTIKKKIHVYISTRDRSEHLNGYLILIGIKIIKSNLTGCQPRSGHSIVE